MPDFDDFDPLLALFSKPRGPAPGNGRNPAGRPFWGVCEDTPQVWVTWVKTLARLTGRGAEVHLEAYGQRLAIVTVPMRFGGERWYFLCPECGRRCEVVYFLAGRAACRKCQHLGYRSQCHVNGSPWAVWDYLGDHYGGAPVSKRFVRGRELQAVFEDVLRGRAERQIKTILAALSWE